MRTKDITQLIPLYEVGRRGKARRIGGAQDFSVQYRRRAEKLAQQFASPADRELILAAYRLAWDGHLGQLRKQGTAYIDHPLRVAWTLGEWGCSAEEVSAGLCHDLLEKGRINGRPITRAMVRERLNERIAAIVAGASELGTEPDAVNVNPSQAEIWTAYLERGLREPAVFKVRLADRFTNMCTLSFTEKKSHRDKAEETLYIYCRLANRLGMWQVKRQLEDMCFKYLYPARYKDLRIRRHNLVTASLPAVHAISFRINKLLREAGLDCDTQMEKRGVYELLHRVRLRGLKEISPADVWRLQVKLKKPGSAGCYQVLGALYKRFPHVRQEERDHATQPLANGHRFLQTVLAGLPFLLTVQIRDPEMQKDYAVGTPHQDFTWAEALLQALRRAGPLADRELFDLFAQYA